MCLLEDVSATTGSGRYDYSVLYFKFTIIDILKVCLEMAGSLNPNCKLFAPCKTTADRLYRVGP